MDIEFHYYLTYLIAVRAGLPKDHEPFTDIRDDRKLDDHERQQVERTRAALGDTDA